MDEDQDFKEVYSSGIDQQELLQILNVKSSLVKDLLSR
jgi:hypothetical protein